MNNNRFTFVVLAIALSLLLANCSDRRQILTANINCSDLEQSIAFYEMLGFKAGLILELDVDAERAAGLGMPDAYQLRTTQLSPPEINPNDKQYGYFIDLIQWTNPYDPKPPYLLVNHLGLSRISLNTTNLDADITTLQAQGVFFFSDPVTINRPVENSRLVCFKDPDGTFIELIELDDAVSGEPNEAGTYITHALRTNVNCSDYEASKSFYERVGFVTQDQVVEEGTPELAAALGLPSSSYQVRAATMTLENGHSLNLTKWEDPFFDGSDPYLLVNHLGIPRFAIMTEIFGSYLDRLSEQGVEFYSEPVRPEGVLGAIRFVCFEDPDGTVIELASFF